MICAACRIKLPGQARFCPSCGARVEPADNLEIRKIVTVLFCDLVGSTELTRKLDPEPLRELMLRYFALMRGCVERHGGTVEKYIGDAVMAVFGVPVVHEDDALRAVRAASQMGEAIAALNDEISAGIGAALNVRIGVNTGSVLAAADSAESLVSGETVNLAARLEQHAKPGEILIGPVTCRVLEGIVDYVPVPALDLKGFAKQVAPGRLMSAGRTALSTRRRLDLPMVNRHSEIAAIREAFGDAVRDRRCELVTLHGEAGIGKTRLAADFTAWARAAGALVTEGRCPGYGAGGSLVALAQAMRGLLAAWQPAGQTAADMTADMAADMTEAMAILNACLLAGDSPGLAPGETVWAICRVLAEVGRDRPLVIVLDDMHWADPALTSVIAATVDGLSGVALMIICLARPEFIADDGDQASGLPGSRLQPVRPLADEDCRLLVAQLDDVMAHDAALVGQALLRAEGNPLYLEQIVDVVAGGGADAIPLGITGLIAYRLDLLAAGERRILGLAAVAGRAFTPAELIAAAGDDLTGRLADVIAALVRRRLIRQAAGAPPVYRFDSALIHEVAYDSMPKGWRAAAHERLAAWLAAGHADAESTGTHWERASRLKQEIGAPEHSWQGLAARAVDALHTAGTNALAGGDPRHAAGLLARSRELAAPSDPRLPGLLLRSGEAELMTGNTEGGRRLLTMAREKASAGQDALIEAHADLQLAYLSPTGQFTASLRAAHKTLPVFELAGDRLGMTRAWLRIGVVEQSRGRHASAIRALRRALEQATLLGASFEQATVLGALAVSLWVGPPPAGRAIAQCLSLLAEYAVGHRTVRAALLCPLAVLRAMGGDHDEASALLDEADQIVSALGNARACVVLPLFRGAASSLAGDLDAAQAWVREALSASRDLGDPQLTETASRDLARIQLLRGQYDEAAEFAAESVPDDVPAAVADRCGVRARVLARLGQAGQARQLSEQALAFAHRTDSPVSRAMALFDTAVMLVDLGDRVGARTMAGRAATWFGHKKHVVGVGWARQVQEIVP